MVKGANLLGVTSMSCVAHSLHLVLAGASVRSMPKTSTNTRRTRKKSSQPALGSVDTSDNVDAPVIEGGDETDDDEAVVDGDIAREDLNHVRAAMVDEVEGHVASASTCTKLALIRVRQRVAIFR